MLCRAATTTGLSAKRRRGHYQRVAARALLRICDAEKTLQSHPSAQRTPRAPQLPPSPPMSGEQPPRPSRSQWRRQKAERFEQERGQRRPHWGSAGSTAIGRAAPSSAAVVHQARSSAREVVARHLRVLAPEVARRVWQEAAGNRRARVARRHGPAQPRWTTRPP